MLGIICQVEQPQQDLDLARANFMDHLNMYGISYGTMEEFEFRFEIFLKNDQKIRETNA
jgi:hypothetical protein